MNLSDFLLIGFLLFLLWGARRLGDFARQMVESTWRYPRHHRAPEDQLVNFALILLLVAAALWRNILAPHL